MPLVQTVEPTELWSDTMTVGSFPGTVFVGWNDANGYDGSSLSDQEFDYGEHTYDLDTIAMVTGGDPLVFRFNESGAGDIANAVTRNKLTLHVGNTSFKMADGSLHRDNRAAVWRNTGLTWMASDMVALKLTTTDPGAPTLTATPGIAKVTLSWTPPPTSGGSAITGYEYRQRTGDDYAAWTEIPNSASLTSYDVTGLTPGTAYTFQLRARNSGGAGLYSDEATATATSAMGPPRITGAPLVGEKLTVDTSGISDDDGLTNASFSYDWIRIEADGVEALLGHAKGKTYRPTPWDVGSRLKVTVSFNDDKGNHERLSSEATEPIAHPGKIAGDFDLHSSNTNPRGIWGNDDTIWVSDTSKPAPRIWAYDRATSVRDPDKDFDTLKDAELDSIYGIWSDGATMYVVDAFNIAGTDRTNLYLYAFSMDDKSRDMSKDITLVSGNTKPRGIWGNSTTIWVANSGVEEDESDKIFAYRLTDDPDTTTEDEYGARDPDKDFDTLETSGIGSPTGIWSDGTWMWVVNRTEGRADAYSMSDRSRESDQDIVLDADNASAAGAWGDVDAGDGGTLWVVDNKHRKLYAYRIMSTMLTKRSHDAKPYITGTPMVGQTLTAHTDTIGDLDGLADDVVFRCQWQRVEDGRDVYISGALEYTSSQESRCTYRPPWRYVGLPIKVVVSFKDARGAFEIRRSDATGPVARGPIGGGFDLTNGGAVPLDGLSGIWGNEKTIWVSNDGIFTPTRLFAYNRSDGMRDADEDIHLRFGPDPPPQLGPVQPGAHGHLVRR